VRRIAQTFLEALGCSVTPCANAEQALPLLVADSVDAALPFDLLLSDIALGAGMRGTDFAAEAERRRPGLPVLLMSGYSSGVLDRPPPWELLHKPFTRAQLARAIVRVLKAA
jgi:CheY-like chemotaxis protein